MPAEDSPQPRAARNRDGRRRGRGAEGAARGGRGARDQSRREGGRQEAARREAARRRRAEIPVPELNYPPELPVVARKDDIAAAIRDHQVVVVAGETGSGKTTQLPKIALEVGRGRDGLIGHTQPRRIAARSVAERIA